MDFGSTAWRWPAFVRSPSAPLSPCLAPAASAAPAIVIDFGARREPPPAALVEVPPGARWQDVTIYPMNGETVGVSLAGGRPLHLHAVEIGMAHKITRNPTVAFELLLHLCAHGGRADWRAARFAEDAPIAFDNFPAFKMQGYALRRALCRIFRIEGDPYASFGKNKELVTAFRALPTPPGETRYVPKPIRLVSHTRISA